LQTPLEVRFLPSAPHRREIGLGVSLSRKTHRFSLLSSSASCSLGPNQIPRSLARAGDDPHCRNLPIQPRHLYRRVTRVLYEYCFFSFFLYLHLEKCSSMSAYYPWVTVLFSMPSRRRLLGHFLYLLRI